MFVVVVLFSYLKAPVDFSPSTRVVHFSCTLTCTHRNELLDSQHIITVHRSLLQFNATTDSPLRLLFDFSYFVCFRGTCVHVCMLVNFRLVVACNQLYMTDSHEQNMLLLIFSLFIFLDTINKLISCNLSRRITERYE